MPAGTVDVSVDGEWSFAQTLRHLILATDTWLRGAVLRIDRPFHPIGQPHAEYETDGYDMSVFTTDAPSYAEVLEVRADHVALVRNFLASVTPGELAAQPEPVGAGPARDSARLPARHPRGGVGAPSLCRPRPGRDRHGPDHRVRPGPLEEL